MSLMYCICYHYYARVNIFTFHAMVWVFIVFNFAAFRYFCSCKRIFELLWRKLCLIVFIVWENPCFFIYMQVTKLCFPKYTWLWDIMHQQAKIKKQSKGFFSLSIALSLCHLSLRGNQVIGSAFLVFLCFLLKNFKKLSMSDLTLSNSAMIVGSPVPPPSHPPWKWKMGVLISDKWPQMFRFRLNLHILPQCCPVMWKWKKEFWYQTSGKKVASDVYISKECSWLAIKEKHLSRHKAQTLNQR